MTTTIDPQKLLTIREIARILGVPTSKLRYAIDAYNVEPKQRAGIIRLWSHDQLGAMKSALLRVAGRRTNG
jgi:DNA-binding transcriptional MerR regulator